MIVWIDSVRSDSHQTRNTSASTTPNTIVLVIYLSVTRRDATEVRTTPASETA